MTETVPLQFEAIDRLTDTVEQMTSAIEALVEAQQASTEATEDNAEAQDDAADSLGKLDKVIAIARNGAELLGMAWDKASAVYEVLSAEVATSLEKWDQYSKRTGVAASSLGGIADASQRAERAQDRVYRSIGRTIEATGLAQIAYNAKRRALDELNKLIDRYDEQIIKAAQDLAGDALGALQSFTQAIEDNADAIAPLLVILNNLSTLLDAAYNAFKILGQFLQLQFYVAVTAISTALAKLIEALQWVITTAGGEVPQAIEDMRLGLEAMADTTERRAVSTLGRMIQTADRASGSLSKFGTSLYDAFTGKDSQLKDAEANVKSFADGLQRRIRELEEELAKARKGGAGRAKLGEEAREAGRQVELLNLQNQIADARAAGNQLLAIELERQLAILEAEQSTVGMISRRQRELTILVGTKTAELDATEKLLGLAEEQKARDEERRARQSEILALAAQAESALISLDAERLQLQARRVRLAQGEGAEAQAIELERAAALKQLEVELAGIENEALRAQTEKIRLQAIELDHQDKLAALQQATIERIGAAGEAWNSAMGDAGALFGEALAEDLAGWQARIDANSAYMERLEQLGQLDAETKARMSAQNEQLAEEMDAAAAAAERQIAAFERASEAAAQLGANIAKIAASNKTLAQSQEEVSAALSGAVGLAGALAGAFTDNVKERAKWEAAFNAAAAIAATALSFANPAYVPVAIGHAAAAVKFGLVASGAIGAGAPSGGAIGGGGGGGAAAQAPMTLDLDRERQLTAESIAESIAANGRGGATVINIDFGSSLIASTSPQAAQEIVDLIAPELSRRIG